MMDKKDMGIGAIIIAVVGGGGGWASYDRMKAHAIEEGSKIWVTLASQNVDLIFEIEDELAEIQRKIDKGKATEDDRIRQAVLMERLKQLKKAK